MEDGSTKRDPARLVHDNAVILANIASHVPRGTLAKTCVVVSSRWLDIAAANIYQAVSLDRFEKLEAKQISGEKGWSLLYLAKVRAIHTNWNEDEVSDLLRRILRDYPGVHCLSGRDSDVDIVKKEIIILRRITNEEGYKSDRVLASKNKWPESYRTIFEMSVGIDAEYGDADHSALLDAKQFEDLQVPRGNVHTPYTCLIKSVSVMWSTAATRPQWLDTVLKLSDLTHLSIRGLWKLEVDDVVRIIGNSSGLRTLDINGDDEEFVPAEFAFPLEALPLILEATINHPSLHHLVIRYDAADYDEDALIRDCDRLLRRVEPSPSEYPNTVSTSRLKLSFYIVIEKDLDPDELDDVLRSMRRAERILLRIPQFKQGPLHIEFRDLDHTNRYFDMKDEWDFEDGIDSSEDE